MNATSVRPLNQMAQEVDQEALIWGGTMEMTDVVAEEDMTGAATGAEAETVGASEGAGVVGTEAALALARWTPGVSTDRIVGRGRISLAPEVVEQLFFLYPVLPLLFCNLPTPDRPWIYFFCQTTVIVTILLVPIKNHHFS